MSYRVVNTILTAYTAVVVMFILIVIHKKNEQKIQDVYVITAVDKDGNISGTAMFASEVLSIKNTTITYKDLKTKEKRVMEFNHNVYIENVTNDLIQSSENKNNNNQ